MKKEDAPEIETPQAYLLERKRCTWRMIIIIINEHMAKACNDKILSKMYCAEHK